MFCTALPISRKSPVKLKDNYKEQHIVFRTASISQDLQCVDRRCMHNPVDRNPCIVRPQTGLREDARTGCHHVVFSAAHHQFNTKRRQNRSCIKPQGWLQSGGPSLWLEDDITLWFPARPSRSSFANWYIACSFIVYNQSYCSSSSSRELILKH